MSEKQISRVLAAIEGGAQTAAEVEAITGLDRAIVSAYLTQLRHDGQVIASNQNGVRPGRPALRYFLAG